MRGDGEEEEASAPLLQARGGEVEAGKGGEGRGGRVAREWWEESKRLWRIVGPAIFQRVALYGINVVSQAFIGHIGDLELAAFSIASTVIAGFNFGFLLGMASALETLCGQAFGAKKHHMLGIYLQRSWIVLFLFALALTPTYVFTEDLLLMLGQTPELSRLAGKMSVAHPAALCHGHAAPAHPLPAEPAQELGHGGHRGGHARAARRRHLPPRQPLPARLRGGGRRRRRRVVGRRAGTVLLRRLRRLPAVMEGVLHGGLRRLLGLHQALHRLRCHALLGELVLQGACVAYGLPAERRDRRGRPLHMLDDQRLGDDDPHRVLGSNWRAGGERARRGQRQGRALLHRCLRHHLHGDWPCVLVPRPHLQRPDRAPLLVGEGRARRRAQPRRAARLHHPPQQRAACPLRGCIGSGWQALVAYVNISSYYLVGVPIGVILGWPLGFGVRGIWSGLIGGTAVQTLVLAYLTMRCDWDDEAMTASTRMKKWANTK